MFELISFPTAGELARAAADAWLTEIAAATRSGKSHLVALSGGRIAQPFLASTARSAGERGIAFNAVHFFWADERCVSPDDPESNFRLAQQLLFAPLGIPENQLHRIRGEEDPETAAARAASELSLLAPRAPNQQPALDLVLLGMGEDGHVASLFPGEPEAIASNPGVYRAVRNAPKPPPVRVTLDYAALVAAREVWVLVSGAGKEIALRESLAGTGKTPLGRVLSLRHRTKVYTDVRGV